MREELLKVYYAHPVETYDTIRERKEVEFIKKFFPNAEVVNPADFQDLTGISHGDMDFFFQLIDTCDLVIYSDLGGFVRLGLLMKLNMLYVKANRYIG